LAEALHYKPEVSVPDGAIGIFKLHNPSGRNMAFGWTKGRPEMRTKILPGEKGGWCFLLTASHIRLPTALNSTSRNPTGL